MKKIPGNLLKNLEKSWKYHGILSVRKVGTPRPYCYGNCIETCNLLCIKYICYKRQKSLFEFVEIESG